MGSSPRWCKSFLFSISSSPAQRLNLSLRNSPKFTHKYLTRKTSSSTASPVPARPATSPPPRQVIKYY
ncbi:hypothetical protein WG66_014086 [Moniliophthora roreri]|nr:hypothetical protein WG66_014086 [Moniliophthora roreri]